MTLLLVVVVMVGEVLGLGWYLWRVSRGNVRLDLGSAGLGRLGQGKAGNGGAGVETGIEAEEYFALQGDDDDGEFSDEEEVDEATRKRHEEVAEKRREEAERLRRLDKV